MGFLRQILDVITAPVRWLLAAPRKLLEGSRRLSGLSLPARVAIFTAVMLVLIVVFALVGFISTHERAFWRAKLTPTFAIATTILVLVIPLVLYKALQLWLEGEVSPYPDIDRAWKAGLAELDRQGIELHQVPLFVVLGTSGVRQEKSLFDAARLELTLRELPAGSAALHWYAGPNGVYLVCSAVGCLSRLAVLGYETLAAERSHAAERRQARRRRKPARHRGPGSPVGAGHFVRVAGKFGQASRGVGSDDPGNNDRRRADVGRRRR